jgi:6-phosphogluconolactonase
VRRRARITIEPTGRFLYIANRDDDTILMFRLDSDGSPMNPIGAALPTVRCPISIAADYSGRFVYVVSETDKTITAYRIRQTTGEIALSGAPSVPTGATPGQLVPIWDEESG